MQVLDHHVLALLLCLETFDELDELLLLLLEGLRLVLYYILADASVAVEP